MEISVQRADLAHAGIIAEFNQQMAMETESKALPDDTILTGVSTALGDNSLGFYLVALETGTGAVVGCLAITYEWSDWRNGLFWWIQSVYVAADYRQQGVFRKMYRTVKELAASDKQVCGIRLYVERENTPAMNTYVKLGMIETHYRLMEEEF